LLKNINQLNMHILNQIIAYKKEEVAVRKLLVPESELKGSKFYSRNCLSLKKNLMQGTSAGIIAKGFINHTADVKEITTAYMVGGASGLSVLTDNHFFGGNSQDLVIARENNIPIVRKDFIIDSYQLHVSKAIGADVILLIAACLPKIAVKELAAVAKGLGMEVLLEIHNEKELDHICADVDMVGVNNRNLKTFEVDIDHSIQLAKLIPTDKIKIAESGIHTVETVMQLKENGYKGFLIGEKFMKENNPCDIFKKFMGQLALNPQPTTLNS
jgi:indole-3-glycerol phosphate synthase